MAHESANSTPRNKCFFELSAAAQSPERSVHVNPRARLLCPSADFKKVITRACIYVPSLNADNRAFCECGEFRRNHATLIVPSSAIRYANAQDPALPSAFKTEECASALAKTLNSGAPKRPSSSTFHPFSASMLCRAAAKQMKLAIVAPVTNAPA